MQKITVGNPSAQFFYGVKSEVREKKQVHAGTKTDYSLILVVLMLCGFGLLILYSATAYTDAAAHAGNAFYTVTKQAVFTAAAVFVMLFVSRVDYHILVKYAKFAYLAAVILGIAVLFFGKEVNGQKRWFALGPLSFQPAEFAKVAVVLFLTYRIEKTRKKTDNLFFMVRTMGWLLPIVGLVGSNNLSTAIIILGIGVMLVFVANPKYLQFIAIGGAGIAFIAVFLSLESYRLERLAIWRDPEAYEKGFQTIQGLYAIGSGGIFGKGFGNSLQKLGFVPEAQNDMIFSIICEELGLFGASVLILIFSLLVWRLMVIATHAADLAGALIASGIMGHMAMQVILNIAVVTNTIPNTGITLPFVSYGGTSVLFLLAEMGLALSVSRRSRGIT